MRSLLLILLTCVLLNAEICCQPLLKNDPAFEPFLQNLVSAIDSNFHLEKHVDFEMRFWTLISKTGEKRLFILSLNKSLWSARLFKRTHYLTDTLVEVSVNQYNLEKLWKKLNKHQLLTIPEEYDLRDKNGNEINDAIHDGISYWFEFSTDKNKRSYSYHCPKSFSEEYKYIKAYKEVVQLINLIYKHCMLKLHTC